MKGLESYHLDHYYLHIESFFSDNEIITWIIAGITYMMGIVFVFNVHQTDSSYTYDSWTVLWNSYPLVSTQFYERYFTIYKNIILVLSFSHQGHLRYISKHIYRHYMKALCKLISSPTRFCRQKFWLLWVYLPLPHLPIIWQMYSIYFFPTDQFLHINKFI